MTDGQLVEDFATRQDAMAFEDLVRRHGPLVYRVCRDVLSDPNDVEDAFQATFLVLVRRAGSIRDPGAVGRWLYETAHRIAVRAKVQARRRQSRETRGVEMAAANPAPTLDRQELRPLVHGELNRLPEALRAPLILCYIEGRSYEDAARRLRLPLGTLKGRLAKGRELLKHRLTRRGVGVTAVLLLALLGEEAQAVPAELLDSTLNSVALTAAKNALPETIPVRVVVLARRELRWHALVLLAQTGIVTGLVAVIALTFSLAAPVMAESLPPWVKAPWSGPELVSHSCAAPAETAEADASLAVP